MKPVNRKRRPPPGGNILAKSLDEAPLADLDGLPVRIVNALERNGIIYVAQIKATHYETLLKLPNFGDKTIQEMRDALKKHNITSINWDKPAPVRRQPGFKRDPLAIIHFDM